MLLRGSSQALHPVLLRTDTVPYWFWQVGDKNLAGTFSGNNWSGMPAASLPRGCVHQERERLAGCRV